jgi:hypothetical protein
MKRTSHFLFCLAVGFSSSSKGFAEQYLVDSWCFGPECPAGDNQVEFDMVGTMTRPGVVQNGNVFTSTCESDPNLGFQSAMVNFGYSLNRTPLPNTEFNGYPSAGNSKALMVFNNSLNPNLASYADVVGDGSPNVRFEITAKVRSVDCKPGMYSTPLVRFYCVSAPKHRSLMAAAREQAAGGDWTWWRRQFHFPGVHTRDGNGTSIVSNVANINLNDCDADLQMQVQFSGISQVIVDRFQVSMWRDQ